MNINNHIALPQKSERSSGNPTEQQSSNFINLTIEHAIKNNSKSSKSGVTITITIIMILVVIIGSLYFYSLRYDSYNNVKTSFEHQDHDIQISQQFKHDKNCYTQGLSFINKTHLLQSCGLYKQSYFHILQYTKTSLVQEIKEVYRSKVFTENIFVEGSVLFPVNQLIYILTWREHAVLRFEKKGNQYIQKDRLKWNHDGWGMTHNGTHLIISDGSSKLYVADENLKIIQTINVLDEDQHPKSRLNQLQFVNQNNHPYIYANVYLTQTIVKIDFNTGFIVETYNITNIVKKEPQAIKNDQVLNGIAYDQHTQSFLLTGKKWKSFYHIEAF